MPWVPELFSAPVLAQFEAKQQHKVVDVPYFDGLVAGEVDALLESFAGEPRIHHPLRGQIEGEYEFREFVADTERWLREHEASVEDVQRSVLPERGFEEVVVHLGGSAARIDLPHGLVADHTAEGRIEELRIYFSTRPLTGHPTERPPLLPADPELRERAAELGAFYAAQLGDESVELEPCVLVEDGDTCALEYNALRPGADSPRAGLTVFVRDGAGRPTAARIYEDLAAPAA